jgi:endonuclease YncB( thermonuclease family)
MKRAYPSRVKPFFLVALLLLLNTLPVLAENTACTVQSIKDGDTLIVEINGTTEQIQLLGIDAPENTENPKLELDLQQTGMTKAQLLEIGDAATRYLQTLVAEGDSITLEGNITRKDRYGRIPAKVINAEGSILGESMVRGGYAIVLPLDRFPDEQEYMFRLDRLERYSRQSNNGLWGSHQEIVRPWYERTR